MTNQLPSREEVRRWVGAHGKTMDGSAWAVLQAYSEGRLIDPRERTVFEYVGPEGGLDMFTDQALGLAERL